MSEKSVFTLEMLESIVAERASASPEQSYTAKLKASGMSLAAKKFGEEAFETVIAAMGEDNNSLVKESADLLYHLLVMLHIRAVTLSDIMIELKKRTSISGLEEKAARKNK